jgi:hypothetical protein
MNKYFIVFLIFFLISCNEREEKRRIIRSEIKKSDTIFVKNIKNELKDTSVLKPKNDFPCPVNDEIEFYSKFGKIKQTGPKNFVCSYQNKSIRKKAVFVNCQLIGRSIDDINGGDTCGYSFVKYADDRIITFDSVDINCKRIVSYVAGRFGRNDPLPKYLLKTTK